MVDYEPRGNLPEVDDTTENENYKLKRALDALFSMLLTEGNNLADIQKVASKLAENVAWPYLRKEIVYQDMTLYTKADWVKYRRHLPPVFYGPKEEE